MNNDTTINNVVEVQIAKSGDKMQVGLRLGGKAFVDRCDPSSARSRAALAKAACKALPGLDADDIEDAILAERERLLSAPPVAAAELDDPQAAGDAELAQMSPSIVGEAREVLRGAGVIEQVARDLVDVGIVGEHELALIVYLMGTSRLLPRPLAGIVQGSSSSGKSHVIECASSLFPAETKLVATDLTTNALYYLPHGSLRHRFVVAGERSRVQDDNTAERSRALREMISAGSLRKVLPQKNSEGVIETVVIENPGPIAFIESTTLAEIFEEDRNRALLLASDDGAVQTRQVVDAIAARYAGVGQADADRVRQRHHAAQRLLRRCKVTIPFAPALAALMPTDRPDARRAIHQVMAVVQAVALLHQFQRTDSPAHGDVIQATTADYRVARLLVAGPLARSLGTALPEHVVSVAKWLRTVTKPGEAFSVPKLLGRDGCRWGRASLYELVKPLVASGYLADAGMDGKASCYRIAGSLPDDVSTWLPSAEALV